MDYLEEKDGRISAYEFKYNPHKKTSQPSAFLKQYPNAEYKVIHRENFMYDFLNI
ncbi:MAG: hypothetical protein K9I68_04970 [Bacteroidales bacterium]|nr:hypothetical protein [Bacteroidales bacterium]MCF8337789.1 hypothetical protein [Bacteroidales bacterium]